MNFSLGRHNQNFVVIADSHRINNFAVACRGFYVTQPFAASSLTAVLSRTAGGPFAFSLVLFRRTGQTCSERSSFAVAQFTNRQQGAADFGDNHSDDLFIGDQVDPFHAASGSAHWASVVVAEANGHAAGGTDDNILIALQNPYVDK